MRESGRWGVGKWEWMCGSGRVYVLCARTRQRALPFALTAGCCHRRWKASAPRHQPEREHSGIVSQWQQRQAAATTITKMAETTTKIKEIRVQSQSRDIAKNESMNEPMNESMNESMNQ